jgi:hypothetical protein
VCVVGVCVGCVGCVVCWGRGWGVWCVFQSWNCLHLSCTRKEKKKQTHKQREVERKCAYEDLSRHLRILTARRWSYRYRLWGRWCCGTCVTDCYCWYEDRPHAPVNAHNLYKITSHPYAWTVLHVSAINRHAQIWIQRIVKPAHTIYIYGVKNK